MNIKGLFLCFLMASGAICAQEEKSRADILFFEYAYEEAVKEYYKEMNEGELTNQQKLNLADSFLQIGNYKQASEKYFEVYKKDSSMSNHHFNKMLQSMVKTSGLDRAKAFLATKTTKLSEELLENAAFNFELLQADKPGVPKLTMFNITANSPQADFAPSFYGDKLLFSSGRPQDSKKASTLSGEGYLDIFVGKVGLGGQIVNPNPFFGIPESKFHEATPYYSSELNTIFYIVSNAVKNKLSFDQNGKNALALGAAEGNGSFRYLLRDLSTSFYYPFYDSKTGKLYFAANFEDSLGGTDIYYVYTNNGQIMSSPINLGPRINTPGNEVAPFIFDNSFFFSSDIFYGIGGMDIYKSEMGPDDFFSIPVNLGKAINSEQDDFGFIIKKNVGKGLIGYFSSNREGGEGKDDIYGFIVEGKPGLRTLVIRGEITEENSPVGIPKVSVKLLDDEDKVIKEVYTKNDGTYRLEIPFRETVKIEVNKGRYSSYVQEYDREGIKQFQNNTMLDIALTPLDELVQEREGQTVLKMNKFFFPPGRYAITPEIAVELDKTVDAIKKFPQLQVRIEAHTDSRGGKASNLTLSQRRADAIKKYLLENGVAASNVPETRGYGEEKITNNCTDGVYCLEILHKQNERHFMVVLNYDLLNN